MNKNQLKNIFAFIVGCLAFLQFRIMGTFALGEIVALASTPFIAFGKFRENKNARQFVYMAFVWLLGVILADIWNGTPMEDRLKGAFNVIFLISIVPFSYWLLYDNPRRWIIYYFGYTLSVLYNYYFQKVFESDFEVDTWRVYAYYPLAMWVAGYLYYKNKHLLSYIAIMMFSVWTLFNFSRNIFLCQTLAVILLLIFNSIKNQNHDFSELFSKRFLRLALGIGVGLFLISYTYENLASSGSLGDRAQKKYMMQQKSRYGIASGRGDFIVSLYMIGRSPVFGYGSYAKDKDKIAFKYKNSHDLNPYNEPYNKNDMIPRHSYILGAWVFAGILGFVFFSYVLVAIWKFFRSGAILYDSRITGLLSYVMALMIWNILFSPFSDRINFVLFMMMLFILQQKQLSEKSIVSNG